MKSIIEGSVGRIRGVFTGERLRPEFSAAFAHAIWRTSGRIILGLLSLLIAALIWHGLSTVVFGPFLVPTPITVATTFFDMLNTGELIQHSIASLLRVAAGFVIGSAVAILVGLIMGRIQVIHDLFDPIIEFLRFLSPTAMIPIAVIWFGIGETSKVFLIFWGVFFFVLINTIAGVVRTPQGRINALLCLGASRWQVFTKVVLPSAIPSIVVGMRVALASAFISIIPAELLAADSGLGYLLQSSSLLLQTDRMFVALATVAAVGFAADRIFRIAVAIVFRRHLQT